jgi:hypothetical protein
MTDTPECNLLEETTLNPADWMDLARCLERERNELRKIIVTFCEQSNWAVDAWKNQDHIKPLFDIHAKTKEGK